MAVSKSTPRPTQKSASNPIQFTRDDCSKLLEIAQAAELLKHLAAGELAHSEAWVRLVADLLNERAWQLYQELDSRFDLAR